MKGPYVSYHLRVRGDRNRVLRYLDDPRSQTRVYLGERSRHCRVAACLGQGDANISIFVATVGRVPDNSLTITGDKYIIRDYHLLIFSRRARTLVLNILLSTRCFVDKAAEGEGPWALLLSRSEPSRMNLRRKTRGRGVVGRCVYIRRIDTGKAMGTKKAEGGCRHTGRNIRTCDCEEEDHQQTTVC